MIPDPKPAASTPVLTHEVAAQLEQGRSRIKAGESTSIACSLDLGLSRSDVLTHADHWHWQGADFPYPSKLRDRTIYFWSGTDFEPAQCFSGSLYKLVPTEWGPPTFEIDGIKMLPTAKVSPLADAQRKVSLVQPRGKVVLDTCGGLGYFARCALEQGAAQVLSYEKSETVRWLRTVNPWSPAPDPRLSLTAGAVEELLADVPAASVGAALHDPPRFGIAGELYSLAFYEQLARVLQLGGLLFHYTGTPNRLTSGRDVPGEVMKRLETAGFTVRREGDGVLAKRATRPDAARRGAR